MSKWGKGQNPSWTIDFKSLQRDGFLLQALPCPARTHSTAPRTDPRCRAQFRGLLHWGWTNNSPPLEHPTPSDANWPHTHPQGQLPGPDSRTAMLYIWTKIRNNYFIKVENSCLENSMDRGAWWATVHGVTKSQTWLRDFSSSLHSRISMWMFVRTNSYLPKYRN